MCGARIPCATLSSVELGGFLILYASPLGNQFSDSIFISRRTWFQGAARKSILRLNLSLAKAGSDGFCIEHLRISHQKPKQCHCKLLKALGAPKDVRIFWDEGTPFGGKEALLSLTKEFSHFYNKNYLDVSFEYLTKSVIGGALIDKYGGKKVISWGVALWSLATLLMPWAANHSTTSLLVVRAFFGLAEGVDLPSMNTLLSRWFPSHERAAVVVYPWVVFILEMS
ncbi:hypothetical protein ACET3Z_012146 [Daucus carota]